MLDPIKNDAFAFSELEKVRNRLLDLTNRNSLLNFSHKGASIRIINEIPNILANNILLGQKFSFNYVNYPNDSDLHKHGYVKENLDGTKIELKSFPSATEWANIQGINTNFELPVYGKVKEHFDEKIQTILYEQDLIKSLKKIRETTNRAIDETGNNILYLALGFLAWRDEENTERFAPLFLIPIKLYRNHVISLGRYEYILEYTGDDIITNISLKEKLRLDYNLVLPDLDEEISPEDYFKLVEETISIKENWEVKRFVTLGVFNFSKLLMYLDLDPKKWENSKQKIEEHPIIRDFFALQSPENELATTFCQEYDIDKLENIHENYPLIFDADSSQHSAIIDVIKGKNLVIEGPPGSGKSQTITNLIAAAIFQGKTILFVAEKISALDVVKSRLEKAGLGDFCLELHSNKIRRKYIYDSISKRISGQEAHHYPQGLDLEIKMYEDKKNILSKYSSLINKEWKNTQKTIHSIFSAHTLYITEFAMLDLDKMNFNHVNGEDFNPFFARKEKEEIRKYADALDEIVKQIPYKDKFEIFSHPWYGVYNTSLYSYDAPLICDLLKVWNIEIQKILNNLEPLNLVLNQYTISTETELKSILKDIEQIPLVSDPKIIAYTSKIEPYTIDLIIDFIKNYDNAKAIYKELDSYFKDKIYSRIDYDKTLDIITIFQNKYQKDISLATLGNLLDKLSNYIINLENIFLNDSLIDIKSQDLNLENLFPLSKNGLKNLSSYLSHIINLDPMLINRRNDLFKNEQLDNCLVELKPILLELCLLEKELETLFTLDKLSYSSILEEINDIMSDAGFFKWFSSSWRNAKRTLIQQAKGINPKYKNLLPYLPNLIRYQKLVEILNKNDKYKTILGQEFNGISTPIEEIIALREWYINVENSYGPGFGEHNSKAESLYKLKPHLFKALQYVAKKDLDNIRSCITLDNELNQKLILIHDADADFLTSLQQQRDTLLESINYLQSTCICDDSLSSIKEKLIKLGEFYTYENSCLENPILQSIFINRKPDIINIKDELYLDIQSSLNLYESIDKLETEKLKIYLFDNINAQTKHILKEATKDIPYILEQYEQRLKSFSDKVQLDKEMWFRTSSGDFNKLLEKNNSSIESHGYLNTWLDFIKIRKDLLQTSNNGLNEYLLYIEGSGQLNQIMPLYALLTHRVLTQEIIAEVIELETNSGINLNTTTKLFQESDEALLNLQRLKIAYTIASNGYTKLKSGNSKGPVRTYTEMGLIKHQINLQKNHMSLRSFIDNAGESLMALKPCFMVSPSSAAQYLSPGSLEFDIVVMDEASQIRPEDALSCIARGKQLVVVGDPKQLPPTNFFNKIIEEDKPEDETGLSQSESILDILLASFEAHRLRWHYRSRHESLIAFSNKEFYDKKLIVFPSPINISDEFGVKLTYVPDGKFISGLGFNIIEADVLINAVREHVILNPHESLGIVAMNAKQSEYIDNALEKLSGEDPIFSNAYNNALNKEEPLFVKNLESVQGDERDVIFMSFTYGGKEIDGQVYQRFGPINNISGGRRLNVLFTRSKKRMHAFSSLSSFDINIKDSSGPGVKALKNFLIYAETNELGTEQAYSEEKENSYFALAIIEKLKQAGFECDTKIGVAGYFIDVAVKDPNNIGHYLMGIESDGEVYNSAKSTRDRDRLRQSVLKRLNWNIKRIWSMDWLKNSEAIMAVIINELNELKDNNMRS